MSMGFWRRLRLAFVCDMPTLDELEEIRKRNKLFSRFLATLAYKNGGEIRSRRRDQIMLPEETSIFLERDRDTLDCVARLCDPEGRPLRGSFDAPKRERFRSGPDNEKMTPLERARNNVLRFFLGREDGPDAVATIDVLVFAAKEEQLERDAEIADHSHCSLCESLASLQECNCETGRISAAIRDGDEERRTLALS